MTKRQIEWCKSHDWFLYSDGASVTVEELFSDGECGILTFTSFVEVYKWAGY